jgi:hypothetical protein
METYSQAGQDLFVMSLFEKEYKGFFVDIGCSFPIELNNTLLLEKIGWDGLSLDIEDLRLEWNIRNTCFVQANALTCDFKQLFDLYKVPMLVDYLSLDIEGNGLRYEALVNVFKSEREFKVITIEHDVYRGYELTERKRQRDFLQQRDYFLLRPDVSLLEGSPFEDWWINPKYVKV